MQAYGVDSRTTVPGVGLNRGVGLIRATTRDVDALTESQALCFRDDGGPSGYDSRRWNRRMVADALYYQITLDGREVGGLIVLRPAWDHFHIVRVWVEPGFQGRGVGSRALALLEASHRQASLWTVEAPAHAHRHRQFYKRNGYRVTRETDRTVQFEKRRPPILRLRSLP
jgi:ribosomal protein S18 acetylase RimI-like enzyme